MKKSTFSILLLIICLFITSCTASVTENTTKADTTVTTEALTKVAAEETLTFTTAEGEVTAIETTVLFKEPKLGSGFAGFIKKGEVAGIKAINTKAGWIIIRYNDKEYYCISSAFSSAENGENLESGGAADLITGETIEVVLPEETTAENTSESAGSQNGTSSEVTTEASLEGSTSEETQGTTKPSSSSSGSTKPSGSTSVKTTEAATRVQTTTKAQPTTAAPKPTQAPVQPTTAAPKPTEAQTQAPATEAPGCNHNWIPNYVVQTVTEQVWVVDQPAGEYPIYEWRTFCNGCDADITDLNDEQFSAHILRCGPGSYHDDYVQTGTEHKEEVGHYETVEKTQYVADGYICTKCGDKK